MEDIIVVAISIPTIIGLIELGKRLFGLPSKVCLGASFAFGVAIKICAAIALGIPNDFAGWFALVGLGLVNGLAASKAWDEWVKKLVKK